MGKKKGAKFDIGGVTDEAKHYKEPEKDTGLPVEEEGRPGKTPASPRPEPPKVQVVASKPYRFIEVNAYNINPGNIEFTRDDKGVLMLTFVSGTQMSFHVVAEDKVSGAGITENQMKKLKAAIKNYTD